MADVPPARLAEIVPGRWEETKRRIAAVRRLMREDDQSGPTIMRYADDLGVSRQMIYKLLGIVRAWDEAADRPSDPTRWRSRHSGSAAAVRDALVEMGSGASAEQVFERAREIGAERGGALPTRPQVYVAMGRTGAGTALARRLRLQTKGVLLDLAPLSVGLSLDEPRRPAVLTGACDLEFGGLAAWTVTDGLPGAGIVEQLVSAMDGRSTSCIMATTPLREISGAPDFVVPPTRVRAGSAIKAAIGNAMGRIRLLPQTTLAKGVAVTVVPETDLRQVLWEVLRSSDALFGSAT